MDEIGVCSGCRTFEPQLDEKTDWNSRQQEIQNILDHYKEKAILRNLFGVRIFGR